MSMILAGPFDIINTVFIKKGMESLLENYNKLEIMKYLKKNLQFQGFKNVDNLDHLNDNQFWKNTFPEMVRLVLRRGDEICSAIKTLVSKSSLVTMLTR